MRFLNYTNGIEISTHCVGSSGYNHFDLVRRTVTPSVISGNSFSFKPIQSAWATN